MENLNPGFDILLQVKLKMKNLERTRRGEETEWHLVARDANAAAARYMVASEVDKPCETLNLEPRNLRSTN